MLNPKIYSIDEIVEQIKRYDFKFRPYAILCHTKYKDLLEKEFGDKFKIIASPLNEISTVYVIDREQFNRMLSDFEMREYKEEQS